jgi:hypothetical protein
VRLHPRDKRLYLFERFGIQLVVNPASVFPVANDSRVLQNAEMERQARLSGIQRIGELTHTSLPFAKQLDDLESGLVGEGVKELDRALGSGVDYGSHRIECIKITCYVNITIITPKACDKRISTVSWSRDPTRHLDALNSRSYLVRMMRRSFAARVLSPLIGLWFMSNSGLLVVLPPCPMHGAGATHASMSMPSSAGHSLGAPHHHDSKSADAHGCDCAGRCGNPPHQFAILDLPAPTPAVCTYTSVQASDYQFRAPSSDSHLPFATGPPTRLFA